LSINQGKFQAIRPARTWRAKDGNSGFAPEQGQCAARADVMPGINRVPKRKRAYGVSSVSP